MAAQAKKMLDKANEDRNGGGAMTYICIMTNNKQQNGGGRGMGDVGSMMAEFRYLGGIGAGDDAIGGGSEDAEVGGTVRRAARGTEREHERAGAQAADSRRAGIHSGRTAASLAISVVTTDSFSGIACTGVE